MLKNLEPNKSTYDSSEINYDTNSGITWVNETNMLADQYKIQETNAPHNAINKVIAKKPLHQNYYLKQKQLSQPHTR